MFEAEYHHWQNHRSEPIDCCLSVRSSSTSGNSWSAGVPAQKAKKTLQKYRRNRQQGAVGGLSGKRGTVTHGGSLALMAPPQPVKRFAR